jgi:hypothetical protein
MSHDEHDPTTARLRAALNAEAAMVQPDDQLSSIRERTEGGAPPWWRRGGVVAVAAAVVLGLAAGGAAAVLGEDDDPTVTVGGKGSSSAAATEQASPSESPSESEGTATPTPATTDDVWVYYVMDDGDLGPRLYREQHSVGTQGDMDAAMSAVREMLSGDAQDPDYASQWPPETELRGWTVDGDTATVDLSQFTTDGSGAEGVAVQQLVYTVTANDPAVSKVRITVNGKTPVADNDWYMPVPRSPRMDIQGLIWLLGPTEGATVSSPVKITGYGTAFEGTISWEVHRQGSDQVVADGFTQGGSMGEFADFSDRVDVEPGTYEMRAFESSAENGRPLHVDSKTFTVE